MIPGLSGHCSDCQCPVDNPGWGTTPEYRNLRTLLTLLLWLPQHGVLLESWREGSVFSVYSQIANNVSMCCNKYDENCLGSLGGTGQNAK